MLASTADPAQYLATARGLYGSGAVATFAAYNHETIINCLRPASLTTQRACDEVAQFPGTEQMLAALRNALGAIHAAAEILAATTADYPAAWQRVREVLDVTWPLRLKSVKEISDFDALKKRTYQATKDLMNDLSALFAPDPAAMIRDLRNLARPLETLLAMADQFERAFTTAKRADNRLDFADLERLALNLLTQPNNLALAELRQRYHFLLVDEFQDINPLQEALLTALRNPAAAHGRGNLFVVGDIKQSIYAFRLAQPQLFLTREKHARQAQPADPAAPRTFIPLQHNFRSHPALLAAMNRIFEKILTPQVVGIDYYDGHDLQPPPHPLPPPKTSDILKPFTGTPVELHLVAMDADAGANEISEERSDGDTDEATDDSPQSENLTAVEHEARIVAERIAALLAENRGISDHGTFRPLRPRDIAILLRTMKNKAMIFARALADRGIPVHADLSSGFFDTQEVKDALALLQVLDNPQQDIPLATVLLGPYGNFSHDDLALIRLTFDRKEVPFAQAVSLLASPPHSANSAFSLQPSAFPPDLAARLRAFFDTLSRWREILRARPLHEGLAEIFAQSKILAYVAGLDTGRQRVANLELLHQRALKFSTFKKQGLHRFLRFIEKLRDQDAAGFGSGGGDIGEAPVLSEASDVVRILSIHKSKGLEFPVVFVSGLGGKLRLSATGPVILHRDLGVGLYATDIDRNISYPSAAALRIADAQRREFRAEELRLLYVALTRARECLMLSGHVAKQSEINKWRDAWKNYRQPLPEDLLLKGTRALDWLMPALAANGVLDATNDPAVIFTLHTPQPAAESRTSDPAGESAAVLARILAAQPLDAVEANPRVDRLIQRVTGTYAHEDAARQPAVQTVTFLKTLEADRESAGETPAALIWPNNTGILLTGAAAISDSVLSPQSSSLASDAETARLRGIATHRLLELLDFAHCESSAALDTQIQRLRAAKQLAPDDAARADLPGIHWFLWQSAAGRRLITAAQKIATGDLTLQLRRELPFTWLASPQLLSPQSSALSPQAPADLPTIRGIIDVLLVNTATRSAEILDYKTDRLWQPRLDDYRRQMGYYLAAASDILGFPVAQATLLFLAPRQEIPV
jgi:ATP-dependent helicase/nuclease subunit A